MTRARRRRDDRGAVVPMVALLLVVLIPSTAMAIDIGMQRVVRRDMQALADAVSMDLVRLVDGRSAAVITSDPQWAATLSAAVARNGATVGSTPSVSAQVGHLDTTTDTFTAYTGAQVPDAVKVTSYSQVKFAFQAGSGGAFRTSVAQSDATACWSLGSYAARVRSELAASGSASTTARAGNLATVVGLMTQVNAGYGVLTVGGYSGLADATVALSDLAAALNVGGVDDLATTNVTLHNFYAAVASVLASRGNTTDAAAMSSLAAGFTSATTFSLGGLLKLDQGSRGIDGNANVLDLVEGSAFLINGSTFLSIPNLTANLPAGLGAVTSRLQVTQGPQTDCSRANASPPVTAQTSQLSASLTGAIASASTSLSIAGLGLASITSASTSGTTLSSSLALASASGSLTNVTCPSAASNVTSMQISTQSGLLNAVTTVPMTIVATSGTFPLVTTATLKVVYTVQNTSPANASSTTIVIPPQAFDTAYSTGSGAFSLPGASMSYTISSQTVTGLDPVAVNKMSAAGTLASIINLVGTTSVSPIVSAIDQQVVTPLADLLGVRLGGADVFALSRPNTTCAEPTLRG